MVNQPIGNHGLGIFWCCQVRPWTPPSRSNEDSKTYDLTTLEDSQPMISHDLMAFISLIIGRRGFGGKDNLWEINYPESYGGVSFDRGPLLQGRMWSLIQIMAYISLTITRGGFGCEDN